MTQTKMQIAANKAWKTIRKNKKLFDGFKKPMDDSKFGIHIEPIPSCNGPNGNDKVFYYKTKSSMSKDIRKFQNDDQVYGITVFEVMYIKANGV